MVDFKVQCLKVFCYHGNKSTILLFNSIFITTPGVSSKLYLLKYVKSQRNYGFLITKGADFCLPNFGLKRSILSLLKNRNLTIFISQ